MDAFADADSCGAGKEEGITEQVVGSTQFLLEALIVLWGERSGQVTGSGREILATNEIRLKGMAVDGQVLQQSSEAIQGIGAGFGTSGWLLFAQPAEPTPR